MSVCFTSPVYSVSAGETPLHNMSYLGYAPSIYVLCASLFGSAVHRMQRAMRPSQSHLDIIDISQRDWSSATARAVDKLDNSITRISPHIHVCTTMHT